MSNPGLQQTAFTVRDSTGILGHRDLPRGTAAFFGLPNRTVRNTSLARSRYLVEVDGSATVVQFNPAVFESTNDEVEFVATGDATLLLPHNALSTDYVVAGWPATPGVDEPLRPYFTIVAFHDSTSVELEVPVTTVAAPNVPQLNAGTPGTFELDSGEVLQIMASGTTAADLTGSVIHASHPVAVFSGHECASVPADVESCDHLETQLLPTSLWGQEYAVAKLQRGGTAPDLFRVVSSQPASIFTDPPMPEVHGTALAAGEFLEFESVEDFVLTASSPVQVAQLAVGGGHPEGLQSGGDPALVVLAPISRFVQRYTVYVPEGLTRTVLHMSLPQETEVMLDGNVVSEPRVQIGSSQWTRVAVPVNPGTHLIEATEQVGLVVYGEGTWISYAHLGGMDFR